MTTEDQTVVIEFLGAPSTHGGLPVERIETHTAIVFLAGTRAWKLKRAVRYDYLDFSTAARRRAMCEAEVHLNRRTAPALYRGVVPITRQADGSFALGGPGSPVDWVIEMDRFDQEALFDRLAVNGRLGVELMAPLATTIAQFHRRGRTVSRPRRKSRDGPCDRGNRRWLRRVRSGHPRPFCVRSSEVRRAGGSRPPRVSTRRSSRGRERPPMSRRSPSPEHRAARWATDPVRRDRVQRHLACIDVLYDLAFLLMDLWRRRLPRHANALWNDYLAATNELDGIALMPLFLSCRAAVRAMTSATASHVQSEPHASKNFARWRVITWPWPSNCCTRRGRHSWRLVDCRDPGNQPSPCHLPRRSARCLARSFFAVMRFARNCAVSRRFSALGPTAIRRRYPAVSIRRSPSVPGSRFGAATASSPMPCLPGQTTARRCNASLPTFQCHSRESGSMHPTRR